MAKTKKLCGKLIKGMKKEEEDGVLDVIDSFETDILEDDNLIVHLKEEYCDFELTLPKKYSLILYKSQILICKYFKFNLLDELLVNQLLHKIFYSIPLSNIRLIKYKNTKMGEKDES